MDKRKLVEQRCANYDKNGHCLLQTFECSTVCPVYYGLSAKCCYFEKSVCPSTKIGAVCERCKNTFERRSNRQKYCTDCRISLSRKRARESMSDKRSNVNH